MRKELFKKIPAVNDLLESNKGKKLIKTYNHDLVLKVTRNILGKKRNFISKAKKTDLKNKELDLSISTLIDEISDYLHNYLKPNLEPVINATGTIVHTNLGRSLLSKEAVQSMIDVAENYSTLEIDKETGQRGSRYNNVRELLIALSAAEDGMVVNNNAAAVLLILDTFAKNKEVILSRGEMVEVGGSFRIPEVMEKSGAKLIEVGATNKVYLNDYEKSISENTALLLKVHTSNYRIMGFTAEVKLEKLVKLGKKYDLPVVEDLGSGIIRDLSDLGLLDEPTVADKIKKGADLVSFSGDKLLGGPQSGIIVGHKEFIDKLKKNPLTRALRVDKFTLSALEATLKAYIKKEDREVIPTLKMLNEDIEIIKTRAEKLKEKIYKIDNKKVMIIVEKDFSKTGGGAFPVQSIPTYVTKVKLKDRTLNDLSYQLRMNNPPIFTRLQDDFMLFDLRTVKEKQLDLIVGAFQKVIENRRK
ncbi:MAG: L-seryl-tRNA(Sec) selenium transferase [Halanaerobiales bacterium]|nr:L-seryl-tRNA(Sec) selenium transferase [Halanaerobiales bacterium]